jgi:phenylalanyl-tRNA synthetase beta chain
MFELDINALMSMMAPRLQYIRISRFPIVKRDISIIVGSGTPAARIDAVIKSAAGSLVKSLDLYDTYRGGQVPEGCKSMTYSIVFQSDAKTLSDDDINAEMAAIIKKLKAEINAELRS